METIMGLDRAIVESRYGWVLWELTDGRWLPVGEVSTGDEAERWVNLKGDATNPRPKPGVHRVPSGEGTDQAETIAALGR